MSSLYVSYSNLKVEPPPTTLIFEYRVACAVSYTLKDILPTKFLGRHIHSYRDSKSGREVRKVSLFCTMRYS